MDALQLDATEQIDRLTGGEISAQELLEACVRRAEALGPSLNVVVAHDLDRARSEARSVDDRRVRGEPVGRLAGLPMTVKDTLDVKGLPASAGRAAFLKRRAEDAAVVRSVRAKDAIVWGKTNTPVDAADWQTYNPLYGATNNPWDQARTPGGSSGGSAVAVATGVSALEIGADIGGSLRIPAGFTGVFAHKPSFGLVPQRGLVPPVGAVADIDLAVVGPMARSARDLRLLLEVIAAASLIPSTVPPGLNGLRVGLWLQEASFTLDPEVEAVIRAFADRLAAAGAWVEEIACPVNAREMMDAYTGLLFPLTNGGTGVAVGLAYEALRGPARLARALGAGPLSWAQGVLATTARHTDWLKANEARARMARRVAARFESLDVIVAPVTPVAAFRHDHSPLLMRRLVESGGRRFGYLQMLNWIALATVFGLPATAVPVGFSGEGLPIGVQVIGPAGQDLRALAVAEAIDGVIGGFHRPPNLA